MSRELLQQALQHLVDLADDLRRIPSDIAQTIAALEAELAKPEQELQMMQIKDGHLSYLKKPWVGLTNEELVEIRETHQAHIFQLMFAVEAKIREKNHGSV